MPITSTLNKDILKGYLFCLHSQDISPEESYSNLLKFTETEIFSLDDVTQLFSDISNNRYEMRSHDNLILAENGVFNEKAVLEFLTYRYSHTFFSELYNELLRVTGKELFSKDFINRWSDLIFKKNHKQMEMNRDFNKNSLLGFLICLKTQECNPQNAYSKLLEVTRQEVISLEQVEKLYEDTTHYFVQDFDDYLWTAVHQYHIMEKIVFFADVGVRKALHQSGGWIRDLINSHPQEIPCIHIDYAYDHIKIKSDLKIPQQTFQNFFGRGCMVHSGNQVWFEKEKHDSHYKCHLKRILKTISDFGNVTVDELKLSTNLARTPDDRYELFPDEQLQIKNCQIKIDNFQGIPHFLPHFNGLTKLVVFVTGNNRFVPRGVATVPQWLALEKLITNQRFDDFGNGEPLAHFKFALFQLHYVVTIDQVLALKDTFLQQPDLREIKITAQMLPDHYDTINIRLGTFNQRGTRTPRWAQFPYPNEPKTLELTVIDNTVWFRGPKWVSGECEKAEEELRSVEELNQGVFEEMEYSR